MKKVKKTLQEQKKKKKTTENSIEKILGKERKKVVNQMYEPVCSLLKKKSENSVQFIKMLKRKKMLDI